jgi:hypothetical protein
VASNDRNSVDFALGARFLTVIAIESLVLSACTTPNIHKTNAFRHETGVETLSIDAKQRVVIFGKVPAWEVDGPDADSEANKKLIGQYQTVTCAEPSPDALSALSTSLSGGASDVKVALNLAYSQAESAASIGLRTQSIQLLRDGMYRLCEGYAAGAVDAPDFNRQQRRYQNLMLVSWRSSNSLVPWCPDKSVSGKGPCRHRPATELTKPHPIWRRPTPTSSQPSPHSRTPRQRSRPTLRRAKQIRLMRPVAERRPMIRVQSTLRKRRWIKQRKLRKQTRQPCYRPAQR